MYSGFSEFNKGPDNEFSEFLEHDILTRLGITIHFNPQERKKNS